VSLGAQAAVYLQPADALLACSEYAKVLKMLGNGRLDAYCYDGVKRLCHIRGKMRKKVWVGVGDIILIGLREYQDSKADVMLKYSPDEARNLKLYGELPDTAKIGLDTGGEPLEDAFGDNEDAFEFDVDDVREVAGWGCVRCCSHVWCVADLRSLAVVFLGMYVQPLWHLADVQGNNPWHRWCKCFRSALSHAQPKRTDFFSKRHISVLVALVRIDLVTDSLRIPLPSPHCTALTAYRQGLPCDDARVCGLLERRATAAAMDTVVSSCAARASAAAIILCLRLRVRGRYGCDVLERPTPGLLWFSCPSLCCVRRCRSMRTRFASFAAAGGVAFIGREPSCDCSASAAVYVCTGDDCPATVSKNALMHTKPALVVAVINKQVATEKIMRENVSMGSSTRQTDLRPKTHHTTHHRSLATLSALPHRSNTQRGPSASCARGVQSALRPQACRIA